VAGLLKFLRIEDVGESSVLFERLLLPSFAATFDRLVSRIGVRTIKEDILRELELPSQKRFMIPVPFTAVEK